MTNCITCKLSLPEEAATGAQYIGQMGGSMPRADDWNTLYEELRLLLSYAQAVTHTFSCLSHYTSDVLHLQEVPEEMESLSALGRDLCQEAQRRAYRLREAARLWESRTQGDASAEGTAQTTVNKEE